MLFGLKHRISDGTARSPHKEAGGNSGFLSFSLKPLYDRGLGGKRMTNNFITVSGWLVGPRTKAWFIKEGIPESDWPWTVGDP